MIMTGGAVGSLVSQFFTLSSLERRTFLVAGAAGGMAATFGSPISAILLAVELLLFEWRPRSLIPVTIACAIAEGIRAWLIGPAPIFGTPLSGTLPWPVLIWALVIGIAAGLVSGALTKLVYLVEDTYRKLPVHWMWWPALGGLAVGLGGLIDPRALGVGYPTIRALDAGHLMWAASLVLFVVKAVIWILSLSSGTSGGVLAPLLLLGGALGMMLSPLFPGHLAGIAATIGMASMLGGTMRAPFTATIFAMETTQLVTIATGIRGIGGRHGHHGTVDPSFNPDRKGGAPWSTRGSRIFRKPPGKPIGGTNNGPKRTGCHCAWRANPGRTSSADRVVAFRS